MESSRSINHENDTSNSAIYCRNASIISNPSNKYDLRKQPNDININLTALQQNPSSVTKCDNKNGYVIVGGSSGGENSTKNPNQQRNNNNNQYRNTTIQQHYDKRKYDANMKNDIIVTNRKMHSSNLTANSYNKRAQQQRHHRNMHENSDSYSSKTPSSASSYGSTCSASSCDGSETSSTSGDPNLPYPGFPELSMNYLTQTMRPRNWCLLLITNPWFERVSILVILFNCITLGMYQPCVDDECVTNRCKILQVNHVFNDIYILHTYDIVGICLRTLYEKR